MVVDVFDDEFKLWLLLLRLTSGEVCCVVCVVVEELFTSGADLGRLSGRWEIILSCTLLPSNMEGVRLVLMEESVTEWR